MIDELGLVDSLNTLLETDGVKRDVSLGILCKALIINGLGFTQRTLYMVSSFFSDKPVAELLGAGIEAEQLNDTVLGRCLDTLYERGCTGLYASLVPQICSVLGLVPKFAHMDSTDFHVFGKKGRPSKQAVPTSTVYYIQGDTAMNTEAFDQMARKKGRFILG
jgi:transposase